LSGIQTGNAPWPVELDHRQERLSVIGLPALSEEGMVLHIHQHLDIFIVSMSNHRRCKHSPSDNFLIKVFVNGLLFNGDPRQIELQQYQEIVVAYGTSKYLANPIPSTYAFPAGV